MRVKELLGELWPDSASRGWEAAAEDDGLVRAARLWL